MAAQEVVAAQRMEVLQDNLMVGIAVMQMAAMEGMVVWQFSVMQMAVLAHKAATAVLL
jgi:hypothetical protein